MSSDRFTTTLPDRQGNSHAYSCLPFGSTESANLFLEVAAIVGGPIGRLISSFIQISMSGDQGVSVKDVDLSAIASLGDIPRRLLDRGGSAFIKRLLSQTNRSKGSEGDWQELGKQHVFDSVYRGNIWEMIQAVKWVMGVNWSPFLTDGTPDWSGLFTMLGDFLPQETDLDQIGTKEKSEIKS